MNLRDLITHLENLATKHGDELPLVVPARDETCCEIDFCFDELQGDYVTVQEIREFVNNPYCSELRRKAVVFCV